LHPIICFDFVLSLICQASTIPRCYPPAPKTGDKLEDGEAAGDVEETVEVADDSEATKDEEDKEQQ
jgi:hypothetical protein